MTTEATTPAPGLKPVYHECLNRTVPTTGIRTIRFGDVLVQPETLAQFENWTAQRKEQRRAMSKGQILDAVTAFAVKNGFTLS